LKILKLINWKARRSWVRLICRLRLNPNRQMKSGNARESRLRKNHHPAISSADRDPDHGFLLTREGPVDLTGCLLPAVMKKKLIKKRSRKRSGKRRPSLPVPAAGGKV